MLRNKYKMKELTYQKAINKIKIFCNKMKPAKL